ncbi:hypothetical protein BJ742DRAFT_898172, partial [Cladochytrium replicatum]
MLESWKQSGLPMKYNEEPLKIRCANGRAEVLEWRRTSGLPLRRKTGVVDIVSANGHVNELEWWQSRGLQMTGLELYWTAMGVASLFGRISVLEWKSGLEIHYTEHSILNASAKEKLLVLDWWNHSGL